MTGKIFSDLDKIPLKKFESLVNKMIGEKTISVNGIAFFDSARVEFISDPEFDDVYLKIYQSNRPIAGIVIDLKKCVIDYNDHHLALYRNDYLDYPGAISIKEELEK